MHFAQQQQHQQVDENGHPRAVYKLGRFDDDPWYKDEWLIIGCSTGGVVFAIVAVCGTVCCVKLRNKRTRTRLHIQPLHSSYKTNTDSTVYL